MHTQNVNLNKKLAHANIYIEFGELEKALLTLNSIEDRKENYNLLLSYGRAYLKLGEFEKASNILKMQYLLQSLKIKMLTRNFKSILRDW